MIQGYLTTAEAARILNVTNGRVRQLVLSGALKAEKIGGKTLVIKQSSIERHQKKRANGTRKVAWAFHSLLQMSLSIDAQRVIRVLLPDGWHDVFPNSFQIDAYEFVERDPELERPYVIFNGGAGFYFMENGRRVDGPMTSLLAVISSTGKQKN